MTNIWEEIFLRRRRKTLVSPDPRCSVCANNTRLRQGVSKEKEVISCTAVTLSSFPFHLSQPPTVQRYFFRKNSVGIAVIHECHVRLGFTNKIFSVFPDIYRRVVSIKEILMKDPVGELYTKKQ